MLQQQLKDMSNALRFLSLWQVEQANSGHPGMPLGAADILTVLFTKFVKFYPKQPKWQDRDRFVLSAGHASALLYSLFYLCGYEDISIDDLKNFRQFGAKTAGHPEYGYLAGVEATTGPLGQGFANAVGMAIAQKKLESELSSELINHRTFVLTGDGCLQEGISQEALELAGHLKLAKLVAIYDSNQITIDGKTSVANSTNTALRFKASGWNVFECDGHDFASIEDALTQATNPANTHPSLVICSTNIGFGSPKQGTADVHGSPLKADDILKTAQNLGWNFGKFEVPQSIADLWREVGKKHGQSFASWQARLNASNLKQKFDAFFDTSFALAIGEIDKYTANQLELKQSNSTRQIGGDVLNAIQSVQANVVIGSADLAKSNCVYTKHSKSITPDDFSGNFLHYGIREHAMAAVMNGIYLHGGLLPIGSTFLVFADYLKPAIRLSALMELGVIYVFTHDSIALGEDGPTHQPIEHLASLRLIPNLRVFRPSDQAETAECFKIALTSPKTPSAFAMSRQNLAYYRQTSDISLVKKGIYNVLTIDGGKAGGKNIKLFASGSELALIIDAAKELAEQNLCSQISVLSVPCLELFDEQDEAYKVSVLGKNDNTNEIRVFVEMANPMSFYKYYRPGTDLLIGIEGFGTSAPAVKAMEHFGFTKSAVCSKIKQIL